MSNVDDTIQEYTTKLEELKEEFQRRLSLQTGATVKRVEVTVIRVLAEIKKLCEYIFALFCIRTKNGIQLSPLIWMISLTRGALGSTLIKHASPGPEQGY